MSYRTELDALRTSGSRTSLEALHALFDHPMPSGDLVLLERRAMGDLAGAFVDAHLVLTSWT